MKNNTLVVFTQAYMNPETGKSNNAGLEAILIAYADYWEQVYYVGPTKSKQAFSSASTIAGNIQLVGLPNYEKSISGRIHFALSGWKAGINFLKSSGILDNATLQFRFPSPFNIVLAYRLRQLNNKKFFYIAGDGVEATKQNSLLLQPFSWFIQTAEYYIVKNQLVVTTGDVLAQKYIPYAKKVHPYYSTTHTQVEKRVPRQGVHNIIYVGSLEKRKRVIDLVNAVKILSKKHKVNCRIVGDGNQMDVLKTTVSELGLNDTIQFYGYVSDREKLASLYAWADVLVLPSLAEGTPRVLPEAMSRGVIPIAIKDVASNNYIITEGTNGMLAAAKSPESIAQKIGMLITDNKKYKHALQGIEDYAEAYTIQKELEKVWAFIDL